MAGSNVVKLPTDFRETAMMQFARDQLKLARDVGGPMFFNGDPFAGATMHAMVRRTLKRIAEWHERNAARVVDLALAGAEDAIEALKDLIAERNARGEPLGPALGTFATILGDRPPSYRRPEGRPGPEQFLENLSTSTSLAPTAKPIASGGRRPRCSLPWARRIRSRLAYWSRARAARRCRIRCS